MSATFINLSPILLKLSNERDQEVKIDIEINPVL